jgi:hypothetical protein
VTTIYVTKYAFTEGVFTCDAEVDSPTFASRNGVQYSQYLHKGEFFLTEEEARENFEKRRTSKLKSLANSMKKIRNAEFKVTQK